MLVKHLARAFYYEVEGQEVRLSDPNPAMHEMDVLNFYSLTYPDLVSAKLSGPEIKDDEVQFKFSTIIGTKG